MDQIKTIVKKNPAKVGVWVDVTKTLVMKNPAKGEVWVDDLNGG